MKNLYKKIFSGFIFILISHLSFAQWQTNGPYGGPAYSSTSAAGKIYIGTENGVFVSSDNGVTWTAANNGIERITIVALATDGTNLYAGGSADGVFFSSNNGASWTPRNNGITTMFITSLFSTSDGIYTGTPDGVFFSADNGMNWTLRNNGIPSSYDMYVYAEMGDTVFAGSYGVGLYQSSNKGVSWVPVANGFPLATGSLNVFVYAIKSNGNTIYAGTSEGVYRSTNRGASWSPSNTGFPTGMWAKSFSVKPGYVFAGTYSEGMFVSTNNGASWSPMNTGLPDMPFPTGLPHNYPPVEDITVSGSSVIAVTMDGVYRSTNNGSSWSESNQGILATEILGVASTGTTAFAGSSRTGVYISNNSGASWTRSNNGLTSYDINSMVIKGSSIFVSAGYENVFRSTDNGATWVSASSGINSMVQELKTDATRVLALTNGATATTPALFQTIDNGANWTEIPTGFGVSMSTVTSTGSALYIGTWNGVVYYSNNNGANWTSGNTGLPAVKINSILVSGSDLFVGTEGFGVYRSTNNGATWSLSSAGLGNLYVNDLQIKNGEMYAATWGGGIYVSGNNGASWYAYNTGLDNLYVNRFSTTSAKVYAGTDAGVFSAPLAITSIEGYELSGIDVYPNPSTGSVSVKTNDNEKILITIHNVAGELVYRYDGYSGAINSIDLAGQSKGIYFMDIQTDKGTAKKKIVIQ
ncbi:MAG: BNR/Asp-box repeat protein [Bacteroidetes bacterium]|jgi:ligand-binding sensor domain-containing protein|nr:BNR/Asp-box repeat protein [Bacteroidota bacterium]